MNLLRISVFITALVLAVLVGFLLWPFLDQQEVVFEKVDPPVPAPSGPAPAPATQITARATLFDDEAEKEGYGLYSYLLFGADSAAYLSKRLAAAGAYLRLIPPSERPEIEQLGDQNVNIFYVPMRGEARGHFLRDENAADFLVRHYNYVRALLLLRRIGINADGVYLAMYMAPLGGTESVDHKLLLVQDLSLVPDEFVELWIVEFRRQAGVEKYWDKLTLRNAMLRLRTALPLAAELIQVTGEALAGAAERP